MATRPIDPRLAAALKRVDVWRRAEVQAGIGKRPKALRDAVAAELAAARADLAAQRAKFERADAKAAAA